MWHRKGPSLPLQIVIVVEPDGDRFHAFCPVLKGLHAGGASEQEAVTNIAQDIPAYIESLVKHGDPLPVGPDEYSLRHPAVQIPLGAFLRHITIQWPGLHTSGIS